MFHLQPNYHFTVFSSFQNACSDALFYNISSHFCLVKFLIIILIFLYSEALSLQVSTLTLPPLRSFCLLILIISSCSSNQNQSSTIKSSLGFTSTFQQMALLFRLNNLSPGQSNYSCKIFFQNNKMSVCIKLAPTFSESGD